MPIPPNLANQSFEKSIDAVVVVVVVLVAVATKLGTIEQKELRVHLRNE